MMKNEEKLKSLSTKEFATKIWLYVSCKECSIKCKCYESDRTCTETWEIWLKSEYEDETNRKEKSN